MDPFEELASTYRGPWGKILECRERSRRKLADVKRELSRTVPPLRPDCSLIVYGSLARLEMTKGSDLDWSLLVDGETDGDDTLAARRVTDVLKRLGEEEPSPGGAFGTHSFSHGLVHKIGGEDDTNINTTRRILLLLESVSLSNPEVRERVLLAVVNRYLKQDTFFPPRPVRTPKEAALFPSEPGVPSMRVPRFLLNDLVRYWRIIAVDYASKTRSQGDRKLAIRNVKLRMSRKLLYAAGLLKCFRCAVESDGKNAVSESFFPDLFREHKDLVQPYVEKLRALCDVTPIDLLAEWMLRKNTDKNIVRKIFDNYNKFLKCMDSGKKRKLLGGSPSACPDLFNQMRDISHEFQEGLTALFFDSDSQLEYFTKKYAVF